MGVGMKNERKKRPMIVLAGPTAVGKTKLSLALAAAVGGEIISADSMQVYRHMNIGTAKITVGEMQNIPHHMIDILDPWEDYNVAMYKTGCEECLPGIYERGRIPIVVGGTGFYIQALLRDISFTENESDSEYRAFLESLAEREGAAYLHAMLEGVDSASAQNIHRNNIKRVIRALEYYHLTGEPISCHNEREREKDYAYQCRYFVLNDIREHLYARIDRRVNEMMDQGLVPEVQKLVSMGCHKGMVSMQGLGYKEILAFLEGECALPEAVEILKQNTRHFAKRQLTWFRRERDVIWVDKSLYDYNDDKILQFMLESVREMTAV